MARNRRLAQSLAGPTQVAARGSSVGGPKKGYQFVAKTGPRAGQSYNVKRGDTGLAERVFASGDTADTPSAAAARRSPMALRNASISPGVPSQDVQQTRKVNANKYLAGQLRARRGRSLGTYLR